MENQLLKLLQKDHPIHAYLRKLENEHVGKLCLVIFQEEGNSRYNQLRQSIAKKSLMNNGILMHIVSILNSRKVLKMKQFANI